MAFHFRFTQLRITFKVKKKTTKRQRRVVLREGVKNKNKVDEGERHFHEDRDRSTAAAAAAECMIFKRSETYQTYLICSCYFQWCIRVNNLPAEKGFEI